MGQDASRFRLAIFLNILNYSVTCIVTVVFTEASENTSTKLAWRNPCFQVPFHFISTKSAYLIVMHSWYFCGHTWFICGYVVVLYMCHIYTVHCTIWFILESHHLWTQRRLYTRQLKYSSFLILTVSTIHGQGFLHKMIQLCSIVDPPISKWFRPHTHAPTVRFFCVAIVFICDVMGSTGIVTLFSA